MTYEIPVTKTQNPKPRPADESKLGFAKYFTDHMFVGLPGNLVDKTPADGLCGNSDEQKLGFAYAVLERYIREGICEDESVRQRIDSLHEQNKFKLELIPTFEPQTMMQ